MQEHEVIPYFRETILFLALAGILIPVLRRLKINRIIGFLTVGMLVGPYGLGLRKDLFPGAQYFSFPNVEDIQPFAQLGVLFLMFMIGLELSVKRLRTLYKWVFGAGSIQVLLCTLAIGLLAWLYGNRLETSVVLGLVLSLSSTAVVMQLMNETRSLDTPLGQASFSILMFQDLAVVPIFILLDVLAEGDTNNLLAVVGSSFAKSIIAIGLIYFLGRKFIRPLYRSFAGKNQPDVFMALTLLCGLGIAGLTAIAGLSMALGAFLAGLLISETEFRHEVEIAIEPFKGLLMGLFFMSVGMQIDWREIATQPILLIFSVAGLFLIKGTVIAIILRVCRFQWREAVQGGLLLGQGGEFAFIVVGSAVATGLLQGSVGQFMMLVVSLSLLITPFAAKLGTLLPVERKQEGQLEVDAKISHVGQRPFIIIAGFGRVGQLLARLMTEQGIAYSAFDNDIHIAMSKRSEGMPIHFGNAAQPAIWEKLDARRASAIILTMDQPVSALQAVTSIRAQYASLPILARAKNEEQAALLKQEGADFVIPETLESTLQLAARSLELTGISLDQAVTVIQQEREKQLVCRINDLRC